MDEKLKHTLLATTGGNLQTWTDDQSVRRGHGYMSHVGNVVELPDGSVAAHVQGRKVYRSRLFWDGESGEMEGQCTCPVGYRCKHTVALALAASQCLQEGRPFPVADLRQKGWRDAAREWGVLVWDAQAFAHWLNGMNADRLRAWVRELANQVPEVQDYFLKQQTRESAESTGDLVRLAEQAIETATQVPDYGSHAWHSDYGIDALPDYSDVLACFCRLGLAGAVDALVDLGYTLIEKASQRIVESMSSSDEIEDRPVSACLDEVASAVLASQMDLSEKLIWEWKVQRCDEYNLLGQMRFSVLAAVQACVEEWQACADVLLGRYREGLADKSRVSVDLKLVCSVLEKAQRPDEVERLLTEEAERSVRGYCDLVNWLVRAGRTERLEDRCRRGLAAARKAKDSYVGETLRDVLRVQKEKVGEWPMAAALALDGFLSRPDMGSPYAALKAASQKAKAWPTVYAFLARHWETGCPLEDEAEWPLPLGGTLFPSGENYPAYSWCIRLALAEKNGGKAMDWYEKYADWKASQLERIGVSECHHRTVDSLGWEVADAAAKARPEASLAFWRAQIRWLEKDADAGNYDLIVKALDRMHPVLKRLSRLGEWLDEVVRLQTQYKVRQKLCRKLSDLVKRHNP